MRRPDVETLVAYANGDLTPEEARQIQRFLEGNSEARQLIEDYRRTLAVGSASIVTPGRKGPPRRPANASVKPLRSTSVAGIAPPPRAAGRSYRAIALVALLAITAGLGVGAFQLRQEEEGPIALGRLSSIDALSSALTRLATGSPDMAGDRAVTILTTFRDEARRPCRQFEISDTSPTAPRIVAIACLDGGAWRIEGSAWLTVDGASGGGASASAEGAGPLAGLLERLGAGSVLAYEEEAALIAGNWQEGSGG